MCITVYFFGICILLLLIFKFVYCIIFLNCDKHFAYDVGKECKKVDILFDCFIFYLPWQLCPKWTCQNDFWPIPRSRRCTCCVEKCHSRKSPSNIIPDVLKAIFERSSRAFAGDKILYHCQPVFCVAKCNCLRGLSGLTAKLYIASKIRVFLFPAIIRVSSLFSCPSKCSPR